MRRRAVIIVASIFVIGLIGWLLFKNIISSKAASINIIEELKSIVEKGSEGLYTLEIGTLNVDPDKMQIILYQIELIPNEGVYQKLKDNGQAGTDLFSLKADKLTINNITPAHLIVSNSIILKSVELHQPQIKVWHEGGKEAGQDTQSNDSTTNTSYIYDQLKKQVSK